MPPGGGTPSRGRHRPAPRPPEPACPPAAGPPLPVPGPLRGGRRRGRAAAGARRGDQTRGCGGFPVTASSTGPAASAWSSQPPPCGPWRPGGDPVQITEQPARQLAVPYRAAVGRVCGQHTGEEAGAAGGALQRVSRGTAPAAAATWAAGTALSLSVPSRRNTASARSTSASAAWYQRPSPVAASEQPLRAAGIVFQQPFKAPRRTAVRDTGQPAAVVEMYRKHVVGRRHGGLGEVGPAQQLSCLGQPRHRQPVPAGHNLFVRAGCGRCCRAASSTGRSDTQRCRSSGSNGRPGCSVDRVAVTLPRSPTLISDATQPPSSSPSSSRSSAGDHK